MTFRLPLVHDLDGAPCLVVGGGQSALRKCRWLAKAGARITLVAPEILPELSKLLRDHSGEIINQPYDPEYFNKRRWRLIICATDNPALHQEIFDAAQTAGILINCVDDPEHCTVTFPAIVDRSPLLIAISTMGAVPALARIVRGWIEERIPLNLADVIAKARELRGPLKERLPDVQARTHAYNQLFSDLQQASSESTDETLERITTPAEIGRVVLVGAGPGDPELITLKGMRAIQTADVILYDKLASPDLLQYARRDAEAIFVGKQGPRPGETPGRPDNRKNQQRSINELIVSKALAGANVVRLKGGDPFIYGRGGEEIQALLEHDIEVTAVPGITAALGAASYAGIPLTHRDHAQSVRFVTGHRVENVINLEWPELGKADQTLVVYMGLVGLREICAKLMEFGAASERPVALVENATLPEQRLFVGQLGNIADIAAANEVTGPTVAIVGDVVGSLLVTGN